MLAFDYEKTNPVFDAFLEEICGEIGGKKNREAVAEELLSHLLEVFDRNTACGMNEEEAAEDAVARMGDREEIAAQFGRLYKNPVSEQTKTTLGCFIWGLLFTTVHIEFFTGMKMLLTALGMLLILRGLFRIYKLNRKTKAAFGLYLGLFGWRLLTDILRLNAVLDAGVAFYGGILYMVPETVFYILLFGGLLEKCRALQGENGKPPVLLPWVLMMDVLAIFGSVDAVVGAVLFFPFLLALILLLRGLVRVRRILADAEPAFNLRQDLNKRERRIFAVTAILLVAVLPLTVQILSACRPPVSASYEKADTAFSREEVDKVRAHIVDLGLPAEVMNDLPDSEIMQYKNALHMESGEENARESDKRIYQFYCEGGTVRLLYCLSGFDEQLMHFRDGFYFEFDPKMYTWMGRENPEPLFLILSEKNGICYRSEPFFEKPQNGIPKSEGCEFAFPHGASHRRAYFAGSRTVNQPEHPLNTYTSGWYFHKKIPIALIYNNTVEGAIQRVDPGGIVFGGDPTYDCRQLYNLVEVRPKWIGYASEKSVGEE